MTPQELKNSILQLAIQGKLVEQRPEEGTAEDLYQQILVEKQRLIKAGKVKKEKTLPEITENEKPFEIPEGWKWCRIGELCSIVRGITFPGSEKSKTYINGCIRCATTGSVQAVYNSDADVFVPEQYIKNVSQWLENGDIIISTANSKELVGKSCLWYGSERMAFGGFLTVVRFPNVMGHQYAYYTISHLHKSGVFARASTQTTNIANLNNEILSKTMIPLPPLAEQKRIVAKIEELLPYIDRYEQAWSKLENFNKRFPEAMQKSILQTAIQGKLVEQRPEEGTGEELYKQIQAEKQRLIKAGKIKKEKPLPEISENEVPFEIPGSWKWVRLPEIGELNRGKSKHRPRNAPELYANGTTPMIQTGDVARANKYIIEWSTMYNDMGVAQSRLWSSGTLCMTIAANIGDVAILSFDACFPDSVVGFNAYNPVVTNDYFMYGLICYKTILDAMSRSTAQKNINLGIITQVAFPLPPLAEQKRIVAKLEELLPLCERLK